ncbi:MAG: VanZ family protein [archaeon]
MIKKNKTITFLFTLLIIIEIFYFSSIPGNQELGTRGNQWIPRVYHFTVFFLFSFFLFATTSQKDIKTKQIILVIILSVTQAFLDEIHQLFVPFRSSSFSDILTNSLGIFSAILIYIYINKNQAQGLNPSPSFLGKR